ncbi:Demethylrebeccamycin-D-glucose O-methyltransferase [Pseudodesulfovibrio hydrargyri]|uniref:Demethylrebeccamycin-D-glucose O-methyltransferase n=1 Tax=Pseudodesulfovibrio hydrargyri TaxID=2125990 RepID=A0A1J5MYA5_9BACT|nr:methyltransferase domain-containing protein [Pseudodesulfovibrio hydrargyri]OIQ51462.1 Demethylrebeccamycin-D-glucose O-methyltransferase [Pseudodesulfovibrio hydrargyri]
MSLAQRPLWEREELRAVAGETLRPGGFTLTDRAAERIGLVPGQRVLDVGAGLGATVARLRSRYGVRAWGVEPSADQLSRADGQPGLVRGCGDRLPFRSGTFDALFCECVLSLFDDRPRGLAEFYRVLKPGGFLVLSDLCASGPLAGSGASCADRAAPLDETARLVRDGGFTIDVLEDHSAHLRDLAARLAWTGEGASCGCGRGLGYFLMIAQKQGAD